MIEPTDTLKRMLDLSQMTLTAARLLPVRLGIEDSRPPSWSVISDYLHDKVELPQDIIGIRQYALSDFFVQGVRILEAIMLLARIPYQSRNAIILSRSLWEISVNAAWLNDCEVSADQQRARIHSWLEWQRLMMVRCTSKSADRIGELDVAIDECREAEKKEKGRLKDTYRENCFHNRSIKQKAKDIEKYLSREDLPLSREYKLMYGAYSPIAHGDLPVTWQLLPPDTILFFAVHECYSLSRILSGIYGGFDLFNEIWYPISERKKEMEHELRSMKQNS